TAISASDDCNFSSKLFHDYLLVLVGFMFVRVLKRDISALISDVEHHGPLQFNLNDFMMLLI
ncbi:MAG: hypothetical protein ACJ72R_19545, partial [Nitrososphaeraceae archaeon]